MTYQELNEKLKLSDEDRKEIEACANKIDSILKKYRYKRDTEYKEEMQMAKRDDLKDAFERFKYQLDNFDNYYV